MGSCVYRYVYCLPWVLKVTEMSKLPHPMTVRKQISYRKILRRWLWVTLAVLALPAWSAASPAPDAATQNLLSSARTWVAQRQSVPESQLQASVLDPRVSAAFATAQGFAWRDQWWLSVVLHDGAIFNGILDMPKAGAAKNPAGLRIAAPAPTPAAKSDAKAS